MPDRTLTDAYITASARHGIAVTPSDTEDLAWNSRQLYIGGTGNLVVIFAGDSATTTFAAVPAGTQFPYAVRRVYSTGTTATNIVAVS